MNVFLDFGMRLTQLKYLQNGVSIVKVGDRKWFGNQEYVINWNNNGAELKEFQGSGLGASKYFGKNTFVWTKLVIKHHLDTIIVIYILTMQAQQ